MKRAFTLVEVMVVVAILGIAAALAIPRLLPEIHKAQLDGDTEAAANFIARARAEAMYSKRCVRVHLGAPDTANTIATTTSSIISAERLNSFDCDQNGATVQLIDNAATLWLTIDTMHTASPNVVYTFATGAPDSARLPPSPGATSSELRFRPNGRVFNNAALTNTPDLSGDDAILVVRHNLIASENEFKNIAGAARRRVLVQGNGLICVLVRGFTPTTTATQNVNGVAGNSFFCP